MPLPPAGHESVLLPEVIQLLNPQPGQCIIDCTIGRGGHALAIARHLGPPGLLIGLDVDPRNLEFAQSRLQEASAPARLFHANFSELVDVLSAAGRSSVDGIVADLGVSSNQLEEGEYGLSFTQSMPLDMRLDPRLTSTAANIVNHLKEQ